MTEISNRPSRTAAGSRFLKALDAMSETLAKGLGRLLEGAVPAPQAIPVRVSSRRRSQG